MQPVTGEKKKGDSNQDSLVVILLQQAGKINRVEQGVHILNAMTTPAKTSVNHGVQKP